MSTSGNPLGLLNPSGEKVYKILADDDEPLYEGCIGICYLIKLRVAFNAINARRLPLALLVYTLVRPPMTTSDYLEQPISPAPVPAQAGQQVAPEDLAAHAAWVKGSKEIAGLMLMTIEPDIQ
ncbi:hypothetical protein Tco_0585498 [Tanacetum coccineum]